MSRLAPALLVLLGTPACLDRVVDIDVTHEPRMDVEDWSFDDAPQTALDYAVRRCASYDRCCDGASDCESGLEGWFLRLAADAERIGATLSPSCYASRLAHLEASCSELGPIDPIDVERDPDCVLFVGEGREQDTCLEADVPFVQPCAEGFFCDEGRCTRRIALGEPCPTVETCAEGVCRDGLCTAIPMLGEPCEVDEDDEHCARGLLCSDGACVSGLRTGERCDSSPQCASQYCDAEGECRTAQPLVCYPHYL